MPLPRPVTAPKPTRRNPFKAGSDLANWLGYDSAPPYRTLVVYAGAYLLQKVIARKVGQDVAQPPIG